MKYEVFFFLIVTLTIVGCTKFVTERFVTAEAKSRLLKRDVHNHTGIILSEYEHLIASCTLDVNLYSAIKEKNKNIIDDSLYFLDIFIKNKSEPLSTYEFYSSNIEVTFLPSNLMKIIQFSEEKTFKWGKSNPDSGLPPISILYFNSFYIPDNIDSITVAFDATLIKPLIFDTTKQSFNYKLYRYEDSYKVSTIGLWMLKK